MPNTKPKRRHEMTPFDLDYFDDAAAKYTRRLELACTPEQLFEVFEDGQAWTEWVPGIAAVDWTTEPPYGEGTTRTMTFTGGMQLDELFIAWDAPKRMAFTTTGATQRVWHRFGENYDIEDLGGERSALTWTVAYEPRAVFAALYPVLRPILPLALGRIIGGLVPYVEQRFAPDRAATST